MGEGEEVRNIYAQRQINKAHGERAFYNLRMQWVSRQLPLHSCTCLCLMATGNCHLLGSGQQQQEAAARSCIHDGTGIS